MPIARAINHITGGAVHYTPAPFLGPSILFPPSLFFFYISGFPSIITRASFTGTERKKKIPRYEGQSLSKEFCTQSENLPRVRFPYVYFLRRRRRRPLQMFYCVCTTVAHGYMRSQLYGNKKEGYIYIPSLLSSSDVCYYAKEVNKKKKRGIHIRAQKKRTEGRTVCTFQ